MSRGVGAGEPWPNQLPLGMAATERMDVACGLLTHGKPAHPQREVVLHHLSDLGLAEHVVRTQCVLHAGRGMAGACGHDAEVAGGVAFIAQLAEAASQLGGGAEGRGPVATDQT